MYINKIYYSSISNALKEYAIQPLLLIKFSDDSISILKQL